MRSTVGLVEAHANGPALAEDAEDAALIIFESASAEGCRAAWQMAFVEYDHTGSGWSARKSPEVETRGSAREKCAASRAMRARARGRDGAAAVSLRCQSASKAYEIKLRGC